MKRILNVKSVLLAIFLVLASSNCYAFKAQWGAEAGTGFQLFVQSNNVDGIYADAAARNTYFGANPTELARLDANQFLIIKLSDDGSGSVAYQQRASSAWVDVTSLIQGVTGPAGATGNSYFFESIAARDTFFNTSPNFALLMNGLPVTVNIGDDTQSTFIWGGNDAPPSYSATLWRLAATEVSSGTLYLGEGGAGVSSGAEVLNFTKAVGSETYVTGIEYDDTGSNQPSYWKLPALAAYPLANVYSSDLSDPQAIGTTSTIDTYVKTYTLIPATSGELRVQTWLGADETGPKLLDTFQTVEPGDIGNQTAFTAPNNTLVLTGQTTYTKFSGVQLKGGLQTSGPFIGQTVPFMTLGQWLPTEAYFITTVGSESNDSGVAYFDGTTNELTSSPRFCYFDTDEVTNVSIHTGSETGQANLVFRDNGAGNKGYLRYDQTADVMRLFTLSGVNIEIMPGAGGNVGINKSVPTSTLSVYENTATSDATTGVVIEQDGTGNPLLQLLTTGIKRWVVGMHNTGSASTSDLVIGDNAGLTDSSRAITVDPNHRVAIGNFPSTDTMYKNLTVYRDSATTAASILIQQKDTTAAGNSDAILEWLVPGRRWAAGIDNSDSDKWMLSPSSGLADAILTVTTDGKIGGNILSPTSGFHLYQNDALTNDTTGIKIEQNGAGDAALHFLITGGDNWSMGIDQSDSERFKLAPNTDVGSSSTIDCSSTDINFLSGRTNLANTATTTTLTLNSPSGSGTFTGLRAKNSAGTVNELEIYYNESNDRSYIIDRSANGVELEAVNGVLFLKSATDDILLDLSSNAGRVEIVGLNHTDSHSIFNIATGDGDVDFYVGEDDPEGGTSAVGGSHYLRDAELLSNYYIKRSTGAATTTGWNHTLLSPDLTSVDNALVTFDGTTGEVIQQSSGVTSVTTGSAAEISLTSPSATGGCAIEFYDNAAALKLSLIHNDNTNENHFVSDEELTIQAIGAALNITSGDDMTINANSGANLITVNDDFVFSDTATDAILSIKTPSATATSGVTLRNNASTAEVEIEYNQNTDIASIILHNEVPLSITGADHDEDDILFTLASQGTNGAQTSETVSNRTPVGNNTANPGSKHTMVSGVDSDTYIHKGASANNTDWKKVLTEYENTITVAKSGGDYTSIKSAYDSATTPSATNRYLISVYPGVYTEAPITLVPYVDLVPVGSRFSTKIVASNTSTALFTGSGIGPVMLSNLVIDGVTTNAGVYNNTVTCAIAVNDCQITNCQYGIHVNNGAVFADGIGTTGTSSMTNMLRATGGLLSAHSCTVQGGGTFTAYAYVDGAELHLGSLHLHGANITTAIHALGAATVDGNNLLISKCTTAVKLEDTADFSVGSLSIGDLVTNHIEIVDSTVVCHITSGEMDSDKFDFPASYSGEIISFIDHKEGDEGQRIFGELGVGRPERGTESVFGEGDSYTRGMLVYTENTGSTFVDVSADARSASGSTFTFTGTAADNAIYIASSLSSADVLEHYGIKTSTSTACVIGSGEIVAEYWTGAAWTEFNAMEADSSGQYLPNAKDYFQETGSHQTRYSTELSDAWTKNDPMTLGTSYYWVRFRIETAVTTAPIFEQFKLHTNRAEINADGFTEGFGSGRSIGTLPWSTANLQAWASSPTNQDLYTLNSTDGADYDLGVGRIENELVSGITDKISFGGLVPLDIDTSSPVRIEVYWVGNNATAGNVLWKTSKGSTSVGDSVGFDTGTAPTTIDGYETTSTIEAVGASENYELKRTVFEFDVSEIISRHADGSSDVLTITINRDGADGTDTYAGNVAIYEIRGTYVKCFDGGHL